MRRIRKIRSQLTFSGFFLLVVFTLLSVLTLSAIEIVKSHGGAPALPEQIVSWQIFTFILAWILLITLVFRRIRARMFWEGLLVVTLFLGVWVYAWFILPFEAALLLAASFIIIQGWMRRVIAHDLFLIVGATGVALNFAFLFSDMILIPFFVALIAYDLVAGRPQGVAAELAKDLIHRGVIPGLILPKTLHDLWAKVKPTVQATDARFLGTGDIVMPMILVARAGANDVLWGAAVSAGVLVGTTYLTTIKTKKSYPALLPLGIGALVPYLLLQLT